MVSADTARLATSLTEEIFLEVTATGGIKGHKWNGFSFVWSPSASGFTEANTRLIAGLNTHQFVEITAMV